MLSFILVSNFLSHWKYLLPLSVSVVRGKSNLFIMSLCCKICFPSLDIYFNSWGFFFA